MIDREGGGGDDDDGVDTQQRHKEQTVLWKSLLLSHLGSVRQSQVRQVRARKGLHNYI
jgi:hypothetical protein